MWCWERYCCAAPERPVGRELLELTRRLDRWEGEEALAWLWNGTPAMVPGLRLTETRAWREDDWEEETTRAGVTADPFCHDLQLSGPARDLLTLCDGTRRGSEIAAEFARIYQLAAAEAAEAAGAFLRELAGQGLVTAETEGAAARSREPGPAHKN
jgi:hypothetical protein